MEEQHKEQNHQWDEQEAARLKELDELKSRFFANISHEFRTPLTLILGQTEQLQEETDDPALQPKFDLISRNALRLLDLINQVLDLAQIEAGKVELDSRPGDFIAFLRHLFASFEAVANQRKLDLVFETEVEPLLMKFDSYKLERVFFNLVSNAVKFTPENGRVRLSVKKSQEHVLVQLEDSGIGIRKEKLPFIFDRFYQVKVEGTQTYTGTGIGLALVRELVEMHKGKVSVESEPGKGTSFTVTLPIVEAKTEELSNFDFSLQPVNEIASRSVADSLIDQTDAADGKARILIVEDNVEVRDYLFTELSKEEYRVFPAEDGKKGLEMAIEYIPDLIISDVMMPFMDGYEFAQEIRKEEKTSHIPIILLTAKASESSKIQGLELGVDDYLFKPFSSRELKVRVANLIRQRQLLRERFREALVIKPSEVSVIPADQVFLEKVLNYVDDNISNEMFGVEVLSEEVGMSVTHLNRKLNALIDKPAGQLIRSMRMQRAVDLLEKNAGNISEVAYAVGYGNPNHFTRSFKKQFGYPPSEFGARNAQ